MVDSASICSFCLGNNTDVPSFGNIADAQDMIHPCSTCSLVAHRKCLLDWFNSLPAESLHIVDAASVHELQNARRDGNAYAEDGGQRERDTTQIHINLSTQSLSRWIANITDGIRTNNLEGMQYLTSKSYLVLMLVQCPHCKQDIVFSMERSPYFAFNTWVRSSIIKMTQYGGMFAGVTFAFTGIFSIGYYGMSKCGLKMVQLILPQPMLSQYLYRKEANSIIQRSLQYQTLPQLFDITNYSVNDLESDLLNGRIDSLTFSRVSILPMILYRMRSSSIVSTLASYSKETFVSNLVEEIFMSGYLSSLGNNELVAKVISNVKFSVSKVVKEPSSLKHGIGAFNGIDFWKTNNMISLLFPLRWVYDLFYRLTFNRGYFRDTLKIRPRDVANTLDPADLERFENVNAEIQSIKIQSLKLRRRILKERKEGSGGKLTKTFAHVKTHLAIIKAYYDHGLFYRQFNLKIMNWFYCTKACLRHDYSAQMLHRSATIRMVTTVLWPWLGSKAGAIIFKIIFDRFDVFKKYPGDKLLFVSNVIGLLGVTIIKDIFNLNLSHKKAKQISRMKVLSTEPLNRASKETVENGSNVNGRLSFPGGYHE